MKSLMKLLLATAMILVMSGGAMAQECFNAQGSTLVPGLRYHYRSASYLSAPMIVVNNITSSTVRCKITFIDHDGNDFSSYANVFTGGGSTFTRIATGTGEFNIPPSSTRMVIMQQEAPVKSIIGYAKIEWRSDDSTLHKALMASGRQIRVDPGSSVSGGNFNINNGQPF